MADTSAQSLLSAASCYACLPMGQLAIIQTELLTEILHSGGTGGEGCILCSQASDPVDAPDCDCALHYRRDNSTLWYWDAALLQWFPLIGP